MNHNLKYSIATVTSSKYIVGTTVLLHTFLKHNKWFNGDIVIIHDYLPAEKTRFFGDFPNVKYMQISPTIKKNVNRLCHAFPELFAGTHKEYRFYSLEAFRLGGYQKVLFLDSDIFIIKDISELFAMREELICCRDGCFYRDQIRDYETFRPIANTFQPHQRTLPDTFNSGFMLIDKSCISEQHYGNLISLINENTWRTVKAGNTDQIVLNHYFRKQYTLIKSMYNYRVNLKDSIYRNENVTLENAKIIHFAGRAKPWYDLKILDEMPHSEAYITVFTWWKNEYLDFLAQCYGKASFLYSDLSMEFPNSIFAETHVTRFSKALAQLVKLWNLLFREK